MAQDGLFTPKQLENALNTILAVLPGSVEKPYELEGLIEESFCGRTPQVVVEMYLLSKFAGVIMALFLRYDVGEVAAIMKTGGIEQILAGRSDELLQEHGLNSGTIR